MEPEDYYKAIKALDELVETALRETVTNRKFDGQNLLDFVGEDVSGYWDTLPRADGLLVYGPYDLEDLVGVGRRDLSLVIDVIYDDDIVSGFSISLMDQSSQSVGGPNMMRPEIDEIFHLDLGEFSTLEEMENLFNKTMDFGDGTAKVSLVGDALDEIFPNSPANIEMALTNKGPVISDRLRRDLDREFLPEYAKEAFEKVDAEQAAQYGELAGDVEVPDTVEGADKDIVPDNLSSLDTPTNVEDEVIEEKRPRGRPKSNPPKWAWVITEEGVVPVEVRKHQGVYKTFNYDKETGKTTFYKEVKTPVFDSLEEANKNVPEFTGYKEDVRGLQGKGREQFYDSKYGYELSPDNKLSVVEYRYNPASGTRTKEGYRRYSYDEFGNSTKGGLAPGELFDSPEAAIDNYKAIDTPTNVVGKDSTGLDVKLSVSDDGYVQIWRATDDPNRLVISDFEKTGGGGRSGLGQQNYFSATPEYADEYSGGNRKLFQFETKIKPNEILNIDLPSLRNTHPELVPLFYDVEAPGGPIRLKGNIQSNIGKLKELGYKAVGTSATGNQRVGQVQFEIIPLIEDLDETYGIKPLDTPTNIVDDKLKRINEILEQGIKATGIDADPDAPNYLTDYATEHGDLIRELENNGTLKELQDLVGGSEELDNLITDIANKQSEVAPRYLSATPPLNEYGEEFGAKGAYGITTEELKQKEIQDVIKQTLGIDTPTNVVEGTVTEMEEYRFKKLIEEVDDATPDVTKITPEQARTIDDAIEESMALLSRERFELIQGSKNRPFKNIDITYDQAFKAIKNKLVNIFADGVTLVDAYELGLIIMSITGAVDTSVEGIIDIVFPNDTKDNRSFPEKVIANLDDLAPYSPTEQFLRKNKESRAMKLNPEVAETARDSYNRGDITFFEHMAALDKVIKGQKSYVYEELTPNIGMIPTKMIDHANPQHVFYNIGETIRGNK